MIRFASILRKFDEQGEKTSWTYVHIPADLAEQLLPGNKKSFRVKGKLDDHPISKVALMPMGEGDFILPINARMRKAIRKNEGAGINVELEVDSQIELDAELMACLEDEPPARDFFGSLPGAHQRYFSRWVQEAKTSETRIKRITMAVMALSRGLGFGEMIRESKGK